MPLIVRVRIGEKRFEAVDMHAMDFSNCKTRYKRGSSNINYSDPSKGIINSTAACRKSGS